MYVSNPMHIQLKHEGWDCGYSDEELDGSMVGEGMHYHDEHLLEVGQVTKKLAGHYTGQFPDLEYNEAQITILYFPFLDTVTRPCTSQPCQLQIEDAFVILTEKSLSDKSAQNAAANLRLQSDKQVGGED